MKSMHLSSRDLNPHIRMPYDLIVDGSMKSGEQLDDEIGWILREKNITINTQLIEIRNLAKFLNQEKMFLNLLNVRFNFKRLFRS